MYNLITCDASITLAILLSSLSSRLHSCGGRLEHARHITMHAARLQDFPVISRRNVFSLLIEVNSEQINDCVEFVINCPYLKGQ